MSLRVVLYSEGSGDDTGERSLRPAPGNELTAEHEGPAHVVMRRALTHGRQIPEAAVRFVSPLRTKARLARGSDLLRRGTLRELLSWATPQRRPQLAIVLLDADGESDRLDEVEDHIRDIELPHVVALAVQEFETWLLADQSAVQKALERPFDTPPALESLAPGEAKRTLRERIAAPDHSEDRRLRLQIAHRVRCEELLRLPAFAAFHARLRVVVDPLLQ